MRCSLLLLTYLLMTSWGHGAQVVEPTASNTGSQTEVQLKERLQDFARSHVAFKLCCLKEHEAEFMRLATEGQAPKTLFVGCSDSRILPNLITGKSFGELFVIRNAGNFVPVYDTSIAWDGTAATLEYGVEALGVTDIIVCGHTHCGAIEALYKDPSKLPALVAKWIKFGADAKDIVSKTIGPNMTTEDKYILTGKISVLFQLEHLTSFPFVKKKVEQNKLFLHGWYYDIATGDIFFYDPETYGFRPLEDALK